MTRRAARPRRRRRSTRSGCFDATAGAARAGREAPPGSTSTSASSPGGPDLENVLVLGHGRQRHRRRPAGGRGRAVHAGAGAGVQGVRAAVVGRARARCASPCRSRATPRRPSKRRRRLPPAARSMVVVAGGGELAGLAAAWEAPLIGGAGVDPDATCRAGRARRPAARRARAPRAVPRRIGVDRRGRRPSSGGGAIGW